MLVQVLLSLLLVLKHIAAASSSPPLFFLRVSNRCSGADLPEGQRQPRTEGILLLELLSSGLLSTFGLRQSAGTNANILSGVATESRPDRLMTVSG